MKKILIFLIIAFSTNLFASEFSSIIPGISFAAGGRYDEVRMCVASPAGFKGGPAFEFAAFVLEGRINQYIGLGFYIPIARPVLFAAAFKMLQFIPEAVISFHVPVNEKIDFATDIGLGASLHYGPDYRSGNNPGDFHGDSFFAAGPRASIFAGFIYYVNDTISFKAGVRPYFEYLIAEQINGKVIGAELDIQLRFVLKSKK